VPLLERGTVMIPVEKSTSFHRRPNCSARRSPVCIAIATFGQSSSPTAIRRRALLLVGEVSDARVVAPQSVITEFRGVSRDG
jgi:hypothetical protein